MRASGHLRFYLAADTQIASKISESPSRTGGLRPAKAVVHPRMLDLDSDNANVVIESVVLGEMADVIENTREEFLRRKRRVTVHGSPYFAKILRNRRTFRGSV